MSYLDCEVVYDGDPHVWVGLQTEGQDGGADEEDRNYPYSLQDVKDLQQQLNPWADIQIGYWWNLKS